MDPRHLKHIDNVKIVVTAKDGRQIEIMQTGDEIADRIKNFMYQTFTHAFSGPVSGPMMQMVLDGLKGKLFDDIRNGTVMMDSWYPTIHSHYGEKTGVYFNLNRAKTSKKYDYIQYDYNTKEEAEEIYKLAHELHESLTKNKK